MALAKSLEGEWEPEFAMPEGPYADSAREIAPVQVIPSVEFSRNFFMLWTFLASWISTNEALRNLCRTRTYSVIHATSLKSMVYAWMLGYKKRIPVIWHHHDIMPLRLSNRLWLKGISLGATKVIVVSQAAKDSLTAAGVPGHKVQVIRNGLDPERWPSRIPSSKGSEKLYIGYVGELSPRKGLDWLPKIFSELDAKYADRYFCSIVGEALSDPEFGVRIRREMQPWLDRKVVEFVGRQENISEWMQKFDVLLVPSRQDPYPTVIMEANFSGTTVIARPRGGIPEMIINGETGYLCSELEDFVDRIKEFLEDRDSLVELAKQARRFAESDFSVSKMARDFESVYSELRK